MTWPLVKRASGYITLSRLESASSFPPTFTEAEATPILYNFAARGASQVKIQTSEGADELGLFSRNDRGAEPSPAENGSVPAKVHWSQSFEPLRFLPATRLCRNCHFEPKARNLSSHMAENARSLAALEMTSMGRSSIATQSQKGEGKKFWD